MSAAIHEMRNDPAEKPIVQKLRFGEYLDGRTDLSDLQRRVARRLASLYNPRRGFAWPTYDQLADDLGAHRRNVIRAIGQLVELGLIEVERSTGRGHANAYRPNFAAVPTGCPYAAARSERVALEAQRVALASLKGGAQTTPSFLRPDIESIRSAAAALPGESGPPSQARPVVSRPKAEHHEKPAEKASKTTSPSKPTSRDLEALQGLITELEVERGALQRAERAIKAGILAHLDVPSLELLQERLDAIAEAHDAHDGDPIGGHAARLALDVTDAFTDRRGDEA